MTRYRYILDCTDKRDPHPEVTDFLEKLDASLAKEVVSEVKSGNLTPLQMFRALGCERFHHRVGRINAPTDTTAALTALVNEGKMTLADSNWGYREAEKPENKDTKPGFDDFFPSSFGYNNIGGPLYDFYLSEKEVVLESNFCNQEFTGGWGSSNIDIIWEKRTFHFAINSTEESVIDEVMAIFEPMLMTSFVEMAKGKLNSSMAEMLAKNMIDKLIKK